MSDLDTCLAMDAEPETARWLDGAAGRNPAAHEDFVRARMRMTWPAGMGYWVIVPQDGSVPFAGWVMLVPEDATGPRIEIGWRVPTALRGRGYAPEAAANLINHGFTTLGLTRIVATIRPSNGASCRVAEKIGMRLAANRDARHPQHRLYEARLDCAI